MNDKPVRVRRWEGVDGASVFCDGGFLYVEFNMNGSVHLGGNKDALVGLAKAILEAYREEQE